MSGPQANPSEEERLKPCPFCGSTSAPKALSAKQIDEYDTSDAANYAVCCRIEAGGCGAVGGFERTRKAAKTPWNRRVS